MASVTTETTSIPVVSRIRRLSDVLAQKIAAGEVVTRPESVVKELLENALDADAQTVTLVLKDAGKTLIQVIDDGKGMDREDARMSIERHATSKLSQFEDLEALKTFGFRGEALAAIASVSHFELRTRQRSSELGTLIEVQGGVFRKCESVACDEGTAISIRNLFFNVPARRKFMKSDATEFKHIMDSVTKAALSHPHVRFIFVSDGDSIFDLPASRPLPERIEQIFGGRLRNALLPVETVTPTIHLHGFVSAPSFVKRVRTEQYFFINGRPITSKGLSFALANAYEHLTEKGAFPSSFLFVEIDPAKIDVNVHPQKLEVKFEDERTVIDEVRHALQAALQKATSDRLDDGALAPDMTMPEHINASDSAVARMRFPDYADASSSESTGTPGRAPRESPNGPEPGGEGSDNRTTLERLFGSKPAELFRESLSLVGESHAHAAPRSEHVAQNLLAQNQQSLLQSAPPIPGLGSPLFREKPVFWQLHNKYIFSQIKSGLMIVDQHVAHERILYERVLKSFDENQPVSQQLLFPQHIDLVPREIALIKDLLPDLEKIGFQLRFFGGNSIIVDGVPSDVRTGREESILHEVLDSFEEFVEAKTLAGRDALAASFACKAAIKSGDKLNQDEMHVLIEQLFQTSMPYVCPHGRPVVIKLAIDELDRRFGRSPVEKMQP